MENTALPLACFTYHRMLATDLQTNSSIHYLNELRCPGFSLPNSFLMEPCQFAYLGSQLFSQLRILLCKVLYGGIQFYQFYVASVQLLSKNLKREENMLNLSNHTKPSKTTTFHDYYFLSKQHHAFCSVLVVKQGNRSGYCSYRASISFSLE